MTEVFQFTLLGLGAGAMYALLAQGVVLIFRGSGVLNLAHGAFAMVSAYLFNTLHVEHQWGTWPALIACVAVATAIGVLTDQLLLRRLRTASPLARLIATLGVLLILQSLGIILWGSTPRIVLPIISPHPVTILGATVTADRLWLLGIAVGLTALLTCVWRYTRAGWVAAAVAQNQRSAAALGWSPERVSALTWGAGAALAGLAGVLISPITQLSVTTLTLILIPALAAALISGFMSFPGALLGGLIVGISQALVGNYVHVTGAADALPLILIVLVLIFRGTALPLRGYVLDRLPEVGSGRVRAPQILAAMAAGLILVSVVTSPTWLGAITATFAIAIVLLSLVVMTGYAGQLSLGQYALAGIGALVAARLVEGPGWPFVLALLAGAVVALVAGLVFALPALRTRGVNLAVVTLALGVSVQSIVFNNSTYVGFTGGGTLGTDVGSVHLLGWNINPTLHPGRYAAVVLVVLGLCSLGVANLRRGRSGRRFLAVRANERAAAASGINVTAVKLHAFGLAGLLAGVGGVMIGFSSTTVTYAGFDPVNSLNAVALVVIGGVGFVLGPVFGGLLSASSIGSVLALEWQDVDKWLPLVSGVGLLITLLLNQAGMMSKNIEVWHALRARLPGRKRVVAPTRLPDAGDAVAVVAPRRLAVENVTVRYGGIKAVDGVSFDVAPGEVVGLIGANGAGKTSLVDALTGFARHSGRVAVDGVAVDRWAPHRHVNGGLVRTWQGDELFLELTVLENVQVSGDRVIGLSPVTDLVKPGSDPVSPVAAAALQRFGLGDCLDRHPDELSYGQRRVVGVARALAAEPSVLLLDEPVAGLDDHESARFAELVRWLADEWGMAILVIEHDMPFVMGITDRIVMIDFGRKIAEGTPAEVRRDAAAIAAYFGQEIPTEAGPGQEQEKPSWTT